MRHTQLRKALTQIRLERGWGFERLAADIAPGELAGITIKRFVEGKTDPHPSTIYRIEQYLTKKGVAA